MYQAPGDNITTNKCLATPDMLTATSNSANAVYFADDQNLVAK